MICTVGHVIYAGSIECYRIRIVTFRYMAVSVWSTIYRAPVPIIVSIGINAHNDRRVVSTFSRDVVPAMVGEGAIDGVVIRNEVVKKPWAPAANINID